MLKPDAGILLVDDFAITRRIIKSHLSRLGYTNIFEAGNGKEALTVAKVNFSQIALIFLDWMMPEMTGIEFLRMIKAVPQFKHFKVIMVTAENKPENVREAQQAGVNNYILKPFDAEIIKRKIELLFGTIST